MNLCLFPRLCLLAGLSGLAVAQDYDLELMAATGSALTSIDSFTSINDRGTVAFSGADATGSRVFVASTPGAPLGIVGGFAGTNYLGVAINNAAIAEVASRRRVSPPLTYLMQKYAESGSGAATTVGRSPTDFDSCVSFLDINDAGVVGFVGLVGGSSSLALFAGSGQSLTQLALYSGITTLLRPQISENNKIVIRDNLNRIISWTYPSGTEVYVGTASGFSATGAWPGISASGNVVAFWGNRGNGEGLFVSVPGATARHVVRIAGEGSDGFTDFDENQRIGVISEGLQPTSQLMSLVFAGTLSGAAGLYTVDAHVEEVAGAPVARIGRPLTVARPGDAIGSKTLGTSLVLTDPCNRCGQVVFTASFTDGTTGVVRAYARKVPPIQRIRVAAKRVLANGAPNPFWTMENVTAIVATASTVLRQSANVELVLDCIEDLPDPNPTGNSLFNVLHSQLTAIEQTATSSMANMAIYRWHTNSINIYFVNQIDNAGGGYCSGPVPTNPCGGSSTDHKEIICIAPGQCAVSPPPFVVDMGQTLAHEIGHYFNLLHTFEPCVAVEAVPSSWPAGTLQAPNGCYAGDLCADTPTDLSNADLNTLQQWYGAGTRFANTALFNAAATNLMSYHCNVSTLTRGQVRRVHQAIDLFRRHVITTSGGLRSFGDSSPGCTGIVPTSTNSCPNIGNQSFALTCSNAPTNAPGVFVLAGGGLAVPLPIFGARLWLDPGSSFFVALSTQSTAQGTASFLLPIPNTPMLVGRQIDTQFLWFGPTSPPPCPPLGWSASFALEITIQP